MHHNIVQLMTGSPGVSGGDYGTWDSRPLRLHAGDAHGRASVSVLAAKASSLCIVRGLMCPEVLSDSTGSRPELLTVGASG